jgi:hypothetical protein
MRQLLVSDLTAPAFTNGRLATGAVCAIEKTASGFTIVNPFSTYATSPEICFVQGTAGGNIFSPWINGKDIFSWAGQNYAAQTAQETRLTFTTAATVAGYMTVKLTEVNNGVEQFRRKSYVIPVTASQSANSIATAFFTAMGADLPSWIASVANGTPGRLDIIGSTFSISANTELASFGTATEGIDSSNGTTVAVSVFATPSKGSGNADVLSEYELSLQGNRGFYNRLVQPNTPASYIVPGETYDLYSIQWLNPQVGQIKGVDNRRTLTIAFEGGTAAIGATQIAFQAALNAYLATVPGAFNPVSLP